MIPTGELRIGNWIKFISTNDLEQIEDIETHDLKHPVINRVNILDVEPIPLTEEWLIKFGFEKANDMDSFYYLMIINDWTRIYYNVKHKICELSISSHGAMIKLKSVHQLQNLYFALTNEELTIKK